MEKKLCFYFCNSLVPEVQHVIQSGDFSDVKVKSFQSTCVGCALNNHRIQEMVGADMEEFAQIVVVVSWCRAKSEDNSKLPNKIKIIQLEQCFEILFNLPTLYYCIGQGHYIVTNGWLRNYPNHVREWGFGKETALRFFGESMKRITLLDTFLPGDCLPDLQKFSEYSGLPVETIPIGTSHLKGFLESIIYDWRNEMERDELIDVVSKLSRESTEYTLIFNHLKQLINLTKEQSIVAEIFKLMDLLFAPEQIIYQYVGPNNSETIYFKPDNQILGYEPENSFEFEIKQATETLGVFGVVGVKFPQYLPRYVNTSHVISQMSSLAIANARRFTELEQTRTALKLSEEHFRTMFEQAPLGIALIDSLNGQIKDLNARFAEIAGRTHEEMRSIDWMQITHPDDVQEDLDNMARLNRGEIAGFQMNKRYLKPDGTIVWISMTVEPIKVDDKAKPVHLCMIEEITDRVMLEEKIHQSERKFKAIMLQSPSVIELYDLDGLQINVNRAYEELWGFPASHTVNKFNILQSEEVKRTGLINYVMRAYNGESVQLPEYEFDATGKTEGQGQGRVRWLSTRIYPIKDRYNKVWNIIVTHEDVTLKKQAEISLASSVEKLKTLTQVGTEMLNLDSVTSIYSLLIETLHQQYPNSILLFNEIDESESFSKLLTIKGVDEKFIEKAIKISGFNFFTKQLKLRHQHLQFFKSGQFFHFQGRLKEFSGGELPKIAAKAIEKLFGIKQIYTIGINKDERLFATIHFFNRGSVPITDNEYIELYVKQAAIIIERKILGEKLSASEERYRLIVENTSDVIWSLNIETLKFSYISPSVNQLTGFTVEEAMQQTVFEALEEKSAEYVLTELPKRITEYYSGNRSRMTETTVLQQKCKDGSLKWVEFTTLFKIDSQGGITDILGVSRNIDLRKKAELEIQEKNRQLIEVNAEKDKLFSIIAHDLRSPFASIMGLIELISNDELGLTLEQIQEIAQSLNKTVISTNNLLENLLDWSRMQRGLLIPMKEPLKLHHLVKHSVLQLAEMAAKKEIDVVANVPEDLFANIDERMIGSVIRNLLSNAIKFTERGGKVTIVAQKQDDAVLVKVTDTGIGIPPSKLPSLFTCSTDVGTPGTEGEHSSGLGLLLCKEFVEKHNGEIGVESETTNLQHKRGSTFYFTLKN
jgi:PAS domain S-box-containing protein